MMITKLFGILNREMARRRGRNAKGHANRERSRKYGSTSSRKRGIPIQETSCHWKTPRRTQPEGGRFDVESRKRANSDFVEVATDIWDRGTKGPIRNPMSSGCSAQ